MSVLLASELSWVAEPIRFEIELTGTVRATELTEYIAAADFADRVGEHKWFEAALAFALNLISTSQNTIW